MNTFNLIDYLNDLFSSSTMDLRHFSERYDITEKPEYKKNRLESEKHTLKETVEYYDRLISEYIKSKEKLKEKIKNIEKDLECL